MNDETERAAAPPSETDWQTPAEKDGYRTTPDYGETISFIKRLRSTYPARVRIESFGSTGEGRDLKLVIVSKDGQFDPPAIHRSGRVVLLVQNAIHAGEMDGKDACLALVRDILRDQNAGSLLDHVVLLFVPVYNIDGHERRSAFNRINQNGPELMGWRANGTNLNLNRDYMKADAPETRAFLRMFHRWLPDFFVDNHVTDGTDFQYDVTFALDATPDVFGPTAEWVRSSITPELAGKIDASGHLAFPSYIFLSDDSDPARGLAFNENPPRFSTGQMILENRPGLLVELHMLKDYRTRVTGDYALMRALLELLNRDGSKLIALNRDADRAASELAGAPSFPLVIEKNGETTSVDYHGVEFTRSPSEVSGGIAVRYGSEPRSLRLVSESGAKVALSVSVPSGYIIPPQWTDVIEVLEAHGVTLRRTGAPWTGRVERYRLAGMRWPDRPFEGRFPIIRGGNVEREMGHFGTCERFSETASYPPNSVVAALNQRLARVVIHWLEPEAPDSALRWGFFSSIFEQKESGEAYVLEKLASEELARIPTLRAEFERRLHSDPGFAANPSARLAFFYDRSPWGLANRSGDYPVGRLPSLDGLPLE